VAGRFTIAEVQVGDVTILRMGGRLELEEGDLVFRDCINRLVDEGHLKIVLDLKAVTRIDSAGIGMLVSKYLTTQKRGGTSKECAPVHHRCPVTWVSAASSSDRISASRSRRAAAFRCRLRAARHRPEQTSWPAWIGTFWQTGHSREASTPPPAGARTLWSAPRLN